ncbi:glycosyltransferase family 2 protein [Bradyrhizobium sp. NC92]|uniref:glycosyltransferase family 2 protein n=1 Tax=Bradyrhizobium sp. (strain NC92) TaxID=55395 RepID=UPI0021A9D570|nr:glycosyltransferase family 2 protein [Bradyrhizobium sp. NC92]UWU67627.1 glycosyltransferase family 2 protein [Bradyrhizobium sp. NC92]
MLLAVIILTYNEERHLDRALKSIADVASEIIIVDSFSTDGTVEIARRYNAVVLQNRFINQAKQFQWALDNAPIRSDWVMRLDADEYIEPDLTAELLTQLPILPLGVTGINLRRKLVFMGRTIKYGGRGILVMTRIWRYGYGRIEDRWMDEHIFVSSGRTVTFSGGFADHNLNDLSHFIEKHNKYATREAVELLNQTLHFMRGTPALSSSSSSRQAAIKRFLKQNIYNRIPFQLSAFAYFFYRYVLRLGFLDGKEGLIYNVLQGFWYRFLVGAKLEELKRAVSDLGSPNSIAKELTERTGFQMEATCKANAGRD